MGKTLNSTNELRQLADWLSCEYDLDIRVAGTVLVWNLNDFNVFDAYDFDDDVDEMIEAMIQSMRKTYDCDFDYERSWGRVLIQPLI